MARRGRGTGWHADVHRAEPDVGARRRPRRTPRGDGSEDGTVRVWDAATGRLQASLPGRRGFTMALFSPTADTVLVANGARIRVGPMPPTTPRWRCGSPEATRWAMRSSTRRATGSCTSPSAETRHCEIWRRCARLCSAGCRSRRSGGGGQPGRAARHRRPRARRAALPRGPSGRPGARPQGLRRLRRFHHDFSADGLLVTAGQDRTARIWGMRAGSADRRAWSIRRRGRLPEVQAEAHACSRRAGRRLGSSTRATARSAPSCGSRKASRQRRAERGRDDSDAGEGRHRARLRLRGLRRPRRRARAGQLAGPATAQRGRAPALRPARGEPHHGFGRR